MTGVDINISRKEMKKLGINNFINNHGKTVVFVTLCTAFIIRCTYSPDNGFHSFVIKKPFEKEELTEAIKEVLAAERI